MRYCPYMKNVEIVGSTEYKRFPGDLGPDAAKTKTIRTSFGECVSNECPFYSFIDSTCRRVESEVNDNVH